jgi:hypothetical protein
VTLNNQLQEQEVRSQRSGFHSVHFHRIHLNVQSTEKRAKSAGEKTPSKHFRICKVSSTVAQLDPIGTGLSSCELLVLFHGW